jgi:lysophospholipase L1-like esterase
MLSHGGAFFNMKPRVVIFSAILLSALPLFAQSATSTYLALGDSIAFGYDPTVAPPITPSKFTGYPDIAAQFLRPRTSDVNAACPGETSGSFLDTSAPDRGCQSFKALFGLHTAYTGPQMAFAVSQLISNPNFKLVTLNIGGNDLLLLQEQCGDPSSAAFAPCVAGKLPLVLSSYANNLLAILTQIRQHYAGKLVLVTQYTPNANPLFITSVQALNSVLLAEAPAFGATVADAFTAFALASAFSGGDPCKAGLLIHLNATTCVVHPSPMGRDLIAATVLVANAR